MHSFFGSLAGRLTLFIDVLAVTYWLGTSLFSMARMAHLVEPVLKLLFQNRSAVQIDHLHRLFRWTAHYLQFFLLFMVLAAWPLRLRPLTALIVCLLLAAADEGHQYFLPDRTCSWFDFGLDAAGVASAFIITIAVRRLRGRPRPRVSGDCRRKPTGLRLAKAAD